MWEINANESTAFNFGRFNTNKTDFFDADTPFAGSDHNPEIIGIEVDRHAQRAGHPDHRQQRLPRAPARQQLRRWRGPARRCGEVAEGHVGRRATRSFVAAGDLIGASTFESFVQKDKPTLEALNAAGLEVSAVGNHEFDPGYDDLLDRVMQPYDADDNPYGADGGLDWEYIGANVVWDDDPDAAARSRPATRSCCRRAPRTSAAGSPSASSVRSPRTCCPWSTRTASRASRSPPIAAAVNDYANQLKAAGADMVVLLVHEGAPSTNCATMDDPGLGRSATCSGTSTPNIDAVISGHTHLEYACSFPVPRVGRREPIKERPVVSAGQYGVALDQLVYSFDTTTGEPVDVTFNNVGVKGPGSTLFSYPEDPTVKAIVDQAVADAVGPGTVVARQDRRPVQAGPAGRRRHREPRWRVDAGQPGRRDPAVGDPDVAEIAARPDRVHEPGRSARRHERHRCEPSRRTSPTSRPRRSSRSPTRWSTWT